MISVMEARGNNRTEHVCVSARPHIEIPHTVVRMLMHQYSACTYWVTTLASTGTPLSASQPQASQCLKSSLHTPEHPHSRSGNETPRWRLPALKLVGDTGNFAEPYDRPDRRQRAALPGLRADRAKTRIHGWRKQGPARILCPCFPPRTDETRTATYPHAARRCSSSQPPAVCHRPDIRASAMQGPQTPARACSLGPGAPSPRKALGTHSPAHPEKGAAASRCLTPEPRGPLLRRDRSTAVLS
jgi:hypothetical protein